MLREKRRFVLIAFALLAAPLAADETPERETDDVPGPEHITIVDGPTILPLDRSSHRITVNAKLNGKGPFEFVFDTGASGFVINDDLARELNVPVTGKSTIGDPSNPQAIPVDLVRLDSMELGGVTLTGVTASSWDRPQRLRRGGTRGVFGTSLLEGLMVTLDYPGARLVIEKGALKPAGDENVLPWKMGDSALPLLPMTVNGKTYQTHIDTGSPAAITLPLAEKDKLKFLRGPQIVGSGQTVSSKFDIWAGQLDGEAKLGSLIVKNPDIDMVPMLDSTGYANLGSRFLRNHVITLDQKSGLVRIAKN